MAAKLKSLVGLAFSSSIALLCLILGCALPQYNSGWPLFVILFHLLSPLPTLFARRYSDDMNTSSALREFCDFVTTGIVLSAFALPIVLARANNVIEWGACMLILTGNVFMFLTIFGFFVAFVNDDGFDYYS